MRHEFFWQVLSTHITLQLPSTNFDLIVNDYRFITSAKVSYVTTKSKKLMIEANFFLLEPFEQVEAKYPDEWDEANPPKESDMKECLASVGINFQKCYYLLDDSNVKYELKSDPLNRNTNRNMYSIFQSFTKVNTITDFSEVIFKFWHFEFSIKLIEFFCKLLWFVQFTISEFH